MTKMTTDQLLDAVRRLIKSTEFCFFVTQGESGHPNARLMQPYEPDKDLTMYFGASPRSRKVRDVLQHPNISLAFYNQQETAYLTMLGSATVVDDPQLLSKYWRSNWNDLFPGGPGSGEYVLIKFVPVKIEMMNFSQQAMPQPYSLHPTALVREGLSWKLKIEAD